MDRITPVEIEEWIKRMGFRYFVDPELKDYNGLVIDIKPRIIVYFSNEMRYSHIMTLLKPLAKIDVPSRERFFKQLLETNAEWNLMKFVIMFRTIGIKIDFDLDSLSFDEFKDGFKALAVAHDEYKRLIEGQESDDMADAMYG